MTNFDIVPLIVAISIISPIIGSAVGAFSKSSDAQVSVMLSFAAGVMLSISFLVLIPRGIELASVPLCAFGICCGAVIMYMLDKVLPHIHPELCSPEHGRNLKKTAVYLMVGIFLHNFPEGMAMAIGVVAAPTVSLTIAVAIAVQKVPEGICTSGPYLHATGNRVKSFLLSTSTVIPLLAGFAFAHHLYQVISTDLIGVIIAATAGIMIYISADELIPTSCSIKTHHGTIFSFMLGVLLVVLLGTL
ncbi:MAG: ZIP family metal transporter [Smithellaceae bacterium]|nr:ZIP family metal transporter [Smithellaceae bacterium]